MEITYNKLFEIIDGLNTLGNSLTNDKFGYVVSKNTPKLQKILKDFNEKVFDINLENAQVDEKGNILKDTKGEFTYSKEGAKKKEVEIRNLKETTFDFEFYKLPELTKVIYSKLGVALCDVFAGTLLDADQVKKANEEWNDFPEDKVEVATTDVVKE